MQDLVESYGAKSNNGYTQYGKQNIKCSAHFVVRNFCNYQNAWLVGICNTEGSEARELSNFIKLNFPSILINFAIKIENFEILENFRNFGKLPFESKRQSIPDEIYCNPDSFPIKPSKKHNCHNNGILSDKKFYREQIIYNSFAKIHMDIMKCKEFYKSQTCWGISGVIIVCGRILYFSNERTQIYLDSRINKFMPKYRFEDDEIKIEIKENLFNFIENRWIILGSFGIWEYSEIEECINKNKEIKDADLMCNKLMMEITSKRNLMKKGYDSMSMIVLKLKNRK